MNSLHIREVEKREVEGLVVRILTYLLSALLFVEF
jgi:hypothetical protein